MPEPITSYTAAGLAAAALLAVLGTLGYRQWKRSQITPAERERRRCVWLVAIGKMGDAVLVEIHGDVVFYSYAVRGVEYTASQDLSLLGRTAVEIEPVHALTVKYDPRNPANSIVLSEQWSGLRPTVLNQSPKR